MFITSIFIFEYIILKKKPNDDWMSDLGAYTRDQQNAI